MEKLGRSLNGSNMGGNTEGDIEGAFTNLFCADDLPVCLLLYHLCGACNGNKLAQSALLMQRHKVNSICILLACYLRVGALIFRVCMLSFQTSCTYSCKTIDYYVGRHSHIKNI